MQDLSTTKVWSRRDAFRLAAVGAAAVGTLNWPRSAWAARAERLSLEDCLKLSPLEMAKRSEAVTANHRFLLERAAEIRDSALRAAVTGILENPAPRILERLAGAQAKDEVRGRLVAAGFLDGKYTTAQLFPPAPGPTAPAQPFLSAPGSGYASHHAYPGGLSTHVALNVRSSLGLAEGYRQAFGLALDRDVILASQLLHDLHKPWIFQWKADRSLLAEIPLAGTGAHHVLSVAESIHRGLPPAVVVAQASAHDHPGSAADEAKTVGYLKAAAIVAGKDPVALGLLGPDGKTVALPRRIENFITHIGDHDWIISSPAVQWTVALLRDIAARDYGIGAGDVRFNAFRNYVLSQATGFVLHQAHVAGGTEAVRAEVARLVAPV